MADMQKKSKPENKTVTGLRFHICNWLTWARRDVSFIAEEKIGKLMVGGIVVAWFYPYFGNIVRIFIPDGTSQRRVLNILRGLKLDIYKKHGKLVVTPVEKESLPVVELEVGKEYQLAEGVAGIHRNHIGHAFPNDGQFSFNFSRPVNIFSNSGNATSYYISSPNPGNGVRIQELYNRQAMYASTATDWLRSNTEGVVAAAPQNRELSLLATPYGGARSVRIRFDATTGELREEYL